MPKYTLFRTYTYGEKEIGTFDSLEEIATFLYNTESDRDEMIAEAYERGDWEGCIRRDFHARMTD